MWIIVIWYERIGCWIFRQCFIGLSLGYLRNLWSCNELADSTFSTELSISFIDQISGIFCGTFIAFFIILTFICHIESRTLVGGCIRLDFCWWLIYFVNTAIPMRSSWLLFWFLRYLWNIAHPIASTVIILKMWHLLVFSDFLVTLLLFILSPVNFLDLDRKRANVIVLLFQKIANCTNITVIAVLWGSSRGAAHINSWWSWMILLSLSYIVLFVDSMRRSGWHRRRVLINKWNFWFVLAWYYFSFARGQIHF